MKLADLPPELLQLILNGPNSWSALELWKAGDRALTAKLANRGVTDVELVDDRADTTSRWPRCLKFLKLDRLSISREKGSFYPFHLFRGELQQLDAGLKVLQLFIPGVLQALLPTSDISSSSANPSSSDALLPISTDANVPLWDIGLTWPSLERLELHSERFRILHTSAAAPCYGAEMLALLPRSLTCLKLYSAKIQPKLELMPPGLLTLHLYPRSLSAVDLAQLPKSITDITHSVDDSGIMLLNRDPNLLPALKHFPLTNVDDHALEMFESTQQLYARESPWPSIMVDMDYSAESAPIDFYSLPSSLTTLDIWTDGTLTDAVIRLLPRGLKHLIALAIDWSAIDGSSWPSSLTTLEVDGANSFDLDCFHRLPRSLTKLRTTKEDASTQVQFDLNFEDLCAIGRASLQSEERWPSMKKHLESQIASNPQMKDYIASIESGRLFGLPLTLKSLAVSPWKSPEDIKLLFPPNFESHRCYVENFDDENLFGAFPPNSAMKLEPTITKTIYSCVQSIISPPSCALLATSLTSLCFSMESFRPQSVGACFKYLPRTLLEFEMSFQFASMHTIKHQELADLPPKLKSFTFAGLICDGIVPWVHYLPKTLDLLYTPYLPIIGKEIKELPPNLTLLECPFFEVSLPQVLDLPRSLSTLVVRRSGGYATTSTRHALTTLAWHALIAAYRPFWRAREAGLAGMSIELSIAEKRNIYPPRTHHHGLREYQLAPVTYRSSSSPTLSENDLKCDDTYIYGEEDVAQYMLESAEQSQLVDPRTSRRVARDL